MSFSTRFIERPIATSLIMVGVLLAGAVALPLLPVAPLPQVDFPTISVSANLPGASPETMASTVATPLEQQFSEIPGVSQMTGVPASRTTSANSSGGRWPAPKLVCRSAPESKSSRESLACTRSIRPVIARTRSTASPKRTSGPPAGRR